MTIHNPIEQAAARVRQAYENRSFCPPVRDLLGDNDLAAGYAVNQFNSDYWRRQGRRAVGRKIALSSKAVQQQMGVNQPTYGMLFADMCLAEGVSIDTSPYGQLKLETEIALVLERPLERAIHTVADIISAVAYAVPAFEIVTSRFNWDVKPTDFVADNSNGCLFTLGSQPRKLSDFDILRCKMRTTLRGEEVSVGSAAACYGNPLNAMIWLADTLAAAGQPLQSGDVVMTGSLGPMAMITAGDVFEAEIEGLGPISLAFDPG